MKAAKIKIFVKTQLQRFWIALQYFDTGGLANHAAAGAFGFLFSAAPALLLAIFFFATAFRSSHETILELIRSIPFMEIAFDDNWLTNELHSFSRYGLSAVISLLGLFWAGRIIAVSLHRGLKVIFTGEKKRKILTENLLVLLIETFVIIFALLWILCSEISIRFFEAFGNLPENFLSFFSKPHMLIIHIAALWLISYSVFRITPANAPSRKSAFIGSVCTVIFYLLVSSALEIIINHTRYNFLYGALGNLIILLLNVYFFFIFFFFGAQLAFVIDNFDALLFSQFRQVREIEKSRLAQNGRPARGGIRKKLFYHIEGKLEKYQCDYPAGKEIIIKGEQKKEIFYLIDGKVDIIIPAYGKLDSLVVSGLTSEFFGEMSHLLSENRTATVKAATDVSVLVLPPELFEGILECDPSLDRAIIEMLSERLKRSNEKISELTASNQS